MNEKIIIEKLGHRGDGVGQSTTGRVFVPFSLAGEEVEIQGKSTRRELVRVISKSSDRVSPQCQYFEKCGGCQLQHFANQPYLQWKQELVIEAFSAQGMQIELQPIFSSALGKRRKAVFSAVHTNEGVEFGFQGMRSHDVVNIDHCLVLHDQISTNIELIKKVIRPILPAKGSTPIHVLHSENGLDIFLETDSPLQEKPRQAAVRMALDTGISRLTYGNETLVEARRPVLQMGIVRVSPPPGIFVQAMVEAENQMAKLVCDHLRSCKTTADLFCGIGTFALRLAENSTVIACESIQSALDALDEGWRTSGGKLKSIKVEKRDLHIRPMMALELKKIKGVVFDPPRAGGEAQARQLAISKCRKIAAVSCNPTTLARDMSILTDGGFKIKSITPIDQFTHTPHVEVVALLER